MLKGQDQDEYALISSWCLRENSFSQRLRKINALLLVYLRNFLDVFTQTLQSSRYNLCTEDLFFISGFHLDKKLTKLMALKNFARNIKLQCNNIVI